jgi:hypothetical protein
MSSSWDLQHVHSNEKVACDLSRRQIKESKD